MIFHKKSLAKFGYKSQRTLGIIIILGFLLYVVDDMLELVIKIW